MNLTISVNEFYNSVAFLNIKTRTHGSPIGVHECRLCMIFHNTNEHSDNNVPIKTTHVCGSYSGALFNEAVSAALTSEEFNPAYER